MRAAWPRILPKIFRFSLYPPHASDFEVSARGGNTRAAATLVHCAATIHGHKIKKLEYDQREVQQRAEALAEKVYRPFCQRLAARSVAMVAEPTAGETPDRVAVPDGTGSQADEKHDN